MSALAKLEQYFFINVDFIERGPNTMMPVCSHYFIKATLESMFMFGEVIGFDVLNMSAITF